MVGGTYPISWGVITIELAFSQKVLGYEGYIKNLESFFCFFYYGLYYEFTLFKKIRIIRTYILFHNKIGNFFFHAHACIYINSGVKNHLSKKSFNMDEVEFVKAPTLYIDHYYLVVC